MATILDQLNPEPYDQASKRLHDAAQILYSLADQHGQNRSFGTWILEQARWAITSLPFEPGFSIDTAFFDTATSVSLSAMHDLADRLEAESRHLAQVADASRRVLQLLLMELGGMGVVATVLDNSVGLVGNAATLMGEHVPGLGPASVAAHMLAVEANGGNPHQVAAAGIGGVIAMAPVVDVVAAGLGVASTAGQIDGQVTAGAGALVSLSDPVAGGAMMMAGNNLASAADRLDPNHTLDSAGALCEDAAQPFAIGMAASGGDPLGGLIGVGIAALVDPSLRNDLWHDTTNLLGNVGNLIVAVPQVENDFHATLDASLFGGGAALLQHFLPPSPFRNDIVNFGNQAALNYAATTNTGPATFSFPTSGN
jgi:hypothetical protein